MGNNNQRADQQPRKMEEHQVGEVKIEIYEKKDWYPHRAGWTKLFHSDPRFRYDVYSDSQWQQHRILVEAIIELQKQVNELQLRSTSRAPEAPEAPTPSITPY